MVVAALEPLADVSVTPDMAALPKADLHLHQEVFPRLERIVARQQGREPYAWRAWARQVMDTVPPGSGRLDAIYRPDQTLGVDRSLDNDLEFFITRVADILAEAAADGAIYVVVRFGADRWMALRHTDPKITFPIGGTCRLIADDRPRLEIVGHQSRLWLGCVRWQRYGLFVGQDRQHLKSSPWRSGTRA